MIIYPYLLKKDLLKQIDDSVTVPWNDIEAWKLPKNQDYLWVYNKLEIARKQKIYCAPVGVTPSTNKFPLFAKPIMNLHGMGLDSHVLKNLRDYQKIKFKSGHFYSTYLTGTFYSIDMLLYQGKIQICVCFRGYPSTKYQSAFDYWETLPSFKLPVKIRNYIEEWLPGYTGCVNIETIGNTIIEVHLRMGDINQIDCYKISCESDDLFFSRIVDCYKSKKPTKCPIVDKIYLIPLFVPRWVYHFIGDINDATLLSLCNRHSVFMIQRDSSPDNVGNPTGGIRIMNLSVTDLQQGQQCRKKILRIIYLAFYFYLIVVVIIIIKICIHCIK